MLEISTGATNQNQGQYAFSVSGVNPAAGVRGGGQAHGEALRVPGVRARSPPTSSTTRRTSTSSIRRDQARTYGVSETRILSLLRNAYSQNYVYLIKKPEDQYQVILEVEDSARAHPEDLSLLYIRSDDGKNLVPL